MARRKGRIAGCLLGCTGLSGVVALVVLALAVVAGVAAYLAYDHYVVKNPGPHLDRAAILSSISQESGVYYRDGAQRVGVFFEDQHRVYLAPEELPPAFAFAIVASEDGAFWSHAGIDPMGMARAMVQNLMAGGVVAGGSTLSQQTAKNLFLRPDRSISSKLGELVNTLRLEAHYDKREILTFYANQFHVAGNGRGLGIAARYFFGVEDPAQLSVLQCAYIAGLVKGPSNYDPFLGDEARQRRALERARDRTRYVLNRIVTEDPGQLLGPYAQSDLDAVRAEAQRLIDQGFQIPFSRGEFRYDRTTVLDEIARRLAGPPYQQLLYDAGIDDFETAGVTVVTTLDATAQREAEYALAHHLTEVGTQLEALPAERFRLDAKPPSYRADRVFLPHTFHTARVAREEAGVLLVDLGGTPCEIDAAGLDRIARLVAQGAKKDKYAKSNASGRAELIAALPPDSVVKVSLRGVDPSGLPTACDLEVVPELQGGLVLVQQGELRAMVGGSENRDFNRARAPRQMGSTWKPLVYHAALELGWRPEDELDNWQNAFHYGTVFYYPSADHVPAPVVTIQMAAVNSENVASIWLLYHLMDFLSFEDFSAVVADLGLAPAEGEDAEAYRIRMQEEGIVLASSRLEEAAFFRARHELLGKVDTWSHPEDELAVRSLLYGWGFTAERERAEAEKSKDDREWKHRVLDHAWTQKRERLQACTDQHRALREAIAERRIPEASEVADLSVLTDGDLLRVACGRIPEGYAAPTAADLEPLFPVVEEVEPEPTPAETTAPEPESKKQRGKRGKPEPAPKPEASDRFHQPWSTPVPIARHSEGTLVPEGDVIVDERLHLSTLRALADAIAPLEGDPYAPENLYWFQDFRVLASIRYVLRLGDAYGIRSEVAEVLPLALGASEISIEEATSLYGGLVSGQSWAFPARGGRGAEFEAPPDPTLLIREIRHADGRVLYQAEPASEPVVRLETAEMTGDLLRSVVEYGTGQRAHGSTKSGKYDVPLGGKTGTTNDFKNTAFLGYVPVAATGTDAEGQPLDGFSLDGAYALGVYTGYDDNRPMRSGNIALSGANGALPAWVQLARSLGEWGLIGTPQAAPAGNRLTPRSEQLARVEDGAGHVLLTWSSLVPDDVTAEGVDAKVIP